MPPWTEFCGLLGQRRDTIDPDGAVVLETNAFPPTAVHAVEFEEMCGRGGAAIELVNMDDIERVFPARGHRPADRGRRKRREARGARYVPCS
jgi:hypothetical protein